MAAFGRIERGKSLVNFAVNMFTWERLKTNVRNYSRNFEVMSNLRSVFIPSLLKLRCLILISWFRAVRVDKCLFFSDRFTNFEQQVLTNLLVPWSLHISPKHVHMQVLPPPCEKALQYQINHQYNLNACFLSGTDLRGNRTSGFSGTRPPTPRKLGFLY